MKEHNIYNGSNSEHARMNNLSIVRRKPPAPTQDQMNEIDKLLENPYTNMQEHAILPREEILVLIDSIQKSASLKQTGKEEYTPEETDCIERGKEALNTLMTHNVKLVISVARRYRGRGVPLDDLIQEGLLGIANAASQFNPSYNTEFSTYAVPHIRRVCRLAIIKYSRNVGLPEELLVSQKKVFETREALIYSLGREPTIEELAQTTAIRPALVRRVLEYSYPELSLDEPVGRQRKQPRSDFISIRENSTQQVEDRLLEKDVLEAVAQLPERYRHVLELRFGLKGREAMTLSQVSKALGITKTRVWQTEKKALQILINAKGAERLKAYLKEFA